jgi:hypothetical protein
VSTDSEEAINGVVECLRRIRGILREYPGIRLYRDNANELVIKHTVKTPEDKKAQVIAFYKAYQELFSKFPDVYVQYDDMGLGACADKYGIDLEIGKLEWKDENDVWHKEYV